MNKEFLHKELTRIKALQDDLRVTTPGEGRLYWACERIIRDIHEEIWREEVKVLIDEMEASCNGI